jgi:REP element-mobilizing transposase RayT
VLALAEKAGGRIVKRAQEVFSGGHSGYLADLDGYYWEVAWGPMFSFAADGSPQIGGAGVRIFHCDWYRILPPASNLRGAIADNLGMSLPRAIVPGRRYMITRRCSERRFFMRPDRETNNAFIYCLAFAARKASVSIVCVGTLSNHYHAVLVDNQGRLPQFLEHFHKLYAKHQNALRGRWEAFWASGAIS